MLKLWSVIAMALIAASSSVSAAQVATRLYVAKNGNDSWSGQLASPNKACTDGPLATLEGARDAVRKQIADAKPTGPVTVCIREGTYFLEKPFELTSADTGTRECPITYEAYRTSKGVERVIVSGGKTISGFKPVQINGHKMVCAVVPGVKEGKWNPDQLFVNDRRADITRLPKKGWYTIKSAPLGDKWQDGQDSFTFNDGEINANWHNLSDVSIHAFTLWVDYRLRIKSLDESNNTVQLVNKSRFWLGMDSHRTKFARYCLENVFEALDTPGQFYLDRAAGLLYYYPLPNEDWRKAQFIAPVLETLVQMTGTDAKPVQHVKLRNLRFSHTMHPLPPDYSGSPQAATEVPATIDLNRSRNVDITHCEISRIGNYGLEFGVNCTDCAIRACKIADIGAGGVKISHGAQRISVRDNEICDGGKIFAEAVGVWIGDSPHNKVIQNHIHDLFYTGVSVGWSWGYGKSGALDNLIALNHIHHIGKGVLSDLAGIYTLGVSPGTILRNNVIHDSESFSYGGWGIYTDEGSSGILIEDNIVYRTKTGGFHQHYGKENILTNNIFAFATIHQLQRTRAEEHKVFTFERNIVYYDTGVLLGNNWSDNNYDMDYNLYWDSSGKSVTFAGASLEEWQKHHDQHSIIADPLFVDPKHDDFRLNPESPSFKLGFKQIDTSKVGPKTEPGIAR